MAETLPETMNRIEVTEPGDPEAPEVGGCSVSGGAGAGLTLLMLAALALVALRRRRD